MPEALQHKIELEVDRYIEEIVLDIEHYEIELKVGEYIEEIELDIEYYKIEQVDRYRAQRYI